MNENKCDTRKKIDGNKMKKKGIGILFSFTYLKKKGGGLIFYIKNNLLK